MGQVGSSTPKGQRGERIAAMRAEEQRRAARRRRLWIAGVAAAVVVIVVGSMLAWKLTGGKSGTAAGGASTSAGASSGASTSAGASSAGFQAAVQAATTVQPPAFAQAGTPTGNTPPWTALSGQVNLTDNGKPELLYVGGEFCPYCATYRWSLVEALSRFGTISGLEPASSAANDGNVTTLTFLHANYTSDYLSFHGEEVQDRQHNPLMSLSPQDQQAYNAAGGQSYPTTVVGGKYALTGTFTPPTAIGSQSYDALATQVADPSTATGQQVLAGANSITAAICSVTGDKPANVCSQPVIQQLQKSLPNGG